MTARPLIFAVGAWCIVAASCVPWTVRPIEEEKAPAKTAAEYVDSIWSSKLVPAVRSGAVDARTLLESPAGRGRYLLVKGTGKVVAVDTRSRAGMAMVDVAPFDGTPDVSIQIGPVLRGNALRDATGIVQFTDFVNQLQFADAGNEINDRVVKTVLASIDRNSLKGRTVTFAGALEAQENASPRLAGLVPVQLIVEGQR